MDNKCTKCVYADMIAEKFGINFTTDNCDIYNDNICPNYTNPTHCGYSLDILNVGMCCGAYSQSKRADGLYWGHYPICEEKNCPLMYPDLLEGAEL